MAPDRAIGNAAEAAANRPSKSPARTRPDPARPVAPTAAPSHGELKLILSVYVDDFKLVGKKENLKEGWRLITGSGLVLDPPTPLGDYLGCGQFPVHVTPSVAQRRLEHVSPLRGGIDDLTKVKAGKPFKAIRYNMFGFFH